MDRFPRSGMRCPKFCGLLTNRLDAMSLTDPGSADRTIRASLGLSHAVAHCRRFARFRVKGPRRLLGMIFQRLARRNGSDHRSKRTTTNTINQTGNVQTKSEITARTSATYASCKRRSIIGNRCRLDQSFAYIYIWRDYKAG
jgi:hypothetical protein